MKRMIFLCCLILFLAPLVWSQEKIETPPEWKVDDRWVFQNQDGGKITFRVVRLEELKGVQYYVV